MSTKHTPGPWHVQPDPQYIGGHPLHQNRFITAGLPDITSDEWQHDPDSFIVCSMRDCQNQEANARLIAAAPELLEAAEWLMAELSSRFDYETATPEEETIFCHMEAVIAKARGDK